MICRRRRYGRIARADKGARSLPSNRISPAVGSISFNTERPIVLLPDPDSPTRPSTSPGAISKLTSSTARTGRSRWPKYFFRPCTRSIGSLTARSSAGSASAGRPRCRPAAASRPNIRARPARNAARTRSRAAGRAGSATWPGIAFSLRVDPRARVSSARRGRQASRPLRVRMPRRPEQGAHIALFDHPAGVHHDDPVGDFGDDAEVVGDEQHGHADVAAAACRAGRESAPGWSRRGPSWARRRSAATGCTRARSRSSPAAACRPTAGADIRPGAASRRGFPRAPACPAAPRAASARPMPRCRIAASAICSPTVNTGLRLVIGS